MSNAQGPEISSEDLSILLGVESLPSTDNAHSDAHENELDRSETDLSDQLKKAHTIFEKSLFDAVKRAQTMINEAGNSVTHISTEKIILAEQNLRQSLILSKTQIDEDIRRVERESYIAAQRGMQNGIMETVDNSMSPILADIRSQMTEIKVLSFHLKNANRVGIVELFLIALASCLGAGIATIAMKLVAG